jgi:hypothetical protein
VTNALMALARLFWDICLFRRGPEDVPASRALMSINLLVYASAGLVILSFDFDASAAFPATLIDTLFLMASAVILLLLFRRPERMRQTITALAGCGALISVLAIPLQGWRSYGVANNLDVSIPELMLLFLFGWIVMVNARIFQRAIDSSLMTAATIALVQIIVSQQLINLVLPSTTGGI